MSNILIIEDEPAQAEILAFNLEADGFSPSTALTAEDGLEKAETGQPDLILLDWMLPDMSGIDVCKALKHRDETRDIPIIMVTARGSEDDKVRGLTVGADDFIVKPYSTRELLARVRSNLRQSGAARDTLSYGGITMDLETHRVERDGSSIHLGPTEFRLLKTLLEKPTRVFSRSRLLDLVWGTDIYVDERTVDVHIGRLRRAINSGERANLIRTIRGAGYALDERA